MNLWAVKYWIPNPDAAEMDPNAISGLRVEKFSRPAKCINNKEKLKLRNPAIPLDATRM